MARPPTTVADYPPAGSEGLVLAWVRRSQGRDPLAPVTILTPTRYARVSLRRALAATGTTPATAETPEPRRVSDSTESTVPSDEDGLGSRAGIANVSLITLADLVHVIGMPELRRRELRLTPAAVELEAIRHVASARPGRLAELISQPGALTMVRSTFDELRRCPTSAVVELATTHGQAGEIARMFQATRTLLREQKYADTADLLSAATQVALVGGSAIDRLGPVALLDLPQHSPTESTFLAALAKHVPVEELRPNTRSEIPVLVVKCADPDEEVRAVVREIAARTTGHGEHTHAEKGQGVPLWRQAIFYPPGSAYPRIIRQQLDAAGITYNGPNRRPLERSVTARILLGLLDMVDGDWSRDLVFAWLSSAPMVDGAISKPIPVGQWDNSSRRAGVIHGQLQWEERLSRCASEGDTHAEDLRRFIGKLFRKSVPPQGSWDDMASWAIGLLDHYLPVKVLGTGASSGWETAAAQEVRSILTGLNQLDYLNDHSRTVQVSTFDNMVRSLLHQASPPDDEERQLGDGVFVAPFSQARGMEFEVAYLLGLADGIVPSRSNEHPLIGDTQRRSGPNSGLRSREERLADEREDLISALRSGHGQRVLLWPGSDPRAGREQSPSRYLNELAGPDAEYRTVPSFAAGVASSDPATGAERALQALWSWTSQGFDLLATPVVRANPRLSLAIQANRSRRSSELTRFDGYAGNGKVQPFDPNYPVSATRLETFATCPRRYLLERVLHLEESIPPEELWQIEPMERGNLVHKILEKYVVERIDGASPSLGRLLAIASERLDDAQQRGLVGKPLLWEIESAAIIRDLRRFFVEDTLEPLAAELAFGSTEEGGETGIPVGVTLADGRRVDFRGRVDRIDITANGHLVVSDYKTGKQRDLRDLLTDPVARGTRLQLPLYAMAARQRFGKGKPIEARYWLLSTNRTSPGFHMLLNATVEERLRDVVGMIADGIGAGIFPGIPGKYEPGGWQHCRHCPFTSLCPSDRARQWELKRTSAISTPIVALTDSPPLDRLQGLVSHGPLDTAVLDDSL